jgi:hypothetical protein
MRGRRTADEGEGLSKLQSSDLNPVIPAQAGIQYSQPSDLWTAVENNQHGAYWIPACAGMTAAGECLHRPTLGAARQ